MITHEKTIVRVSLSLGVLVAMVLAIASRPALAQEKGDSAKAKAAEPTAQDKAPQKAESRKPKVESSQAGRARGAAQSDEPPPALRRPDVKPSGKVQPLRPARGARGKRGAVIPKPTVVLKPGEEPKIRFDTREFDFGRLRAGEPVQHDFWFTNVGTGPLELLRVKPG